MGQLAQAAWAKKWAAPQAVQCNGLGCLGPSSAHGCKCVSTRWRDLIAHPDHRKKLPRSTLAGFFYKTYDMASRPHDLHGYRSVSGNWCPIDASLSFLPKCEEIDLLDCCNGLLLCRRSKPYPEEPDYVVCNPATEKWVTFPANEWSSESYARLGFDPAVSSHFYVFELVPAVALNWNLKYEYDIEEVGIYSSKAGGWTHQIEWDDPIEIRNFSGGTFLSGVLYLCSYNNLVAAIDVEGNCRFIPVPTLNDARCGPYIYASRGQLYVANYGAAEVSIWVLEDSSSEDYWTLKHNDSEVRS
ncbi:uncharacterized protein LOC119272914 [Triticum dicoccoides]|uniref:uncharacterized protein LOC119272914 n=1 Tax=Triticum dicoccoides TaxID=85692 RepID=UPI0018906811|nr:uncharacterized protein LOC119272914 [Triticum dicoccoides]